VAEGFAKRGATVVATSIEPPDVPSAAMNLLWDVADPAQADAAVKAVVDRCGRIDCLVANAGYDPFADWRELSPKQWRDILAVNLDGAWFAAQAAAKVMAQRGYGKIVLVSSILAQLGAGDRPHYGTAKAALLGLCHSLARALGKDGIRVNVIMPGAILTQRQLTMFPDQEASRRFLNKMQSIDGRLEPGDIEPSFAFLCAAESDPITGQVLCADLGWHYY
jgi:3-oxoacyl-[acyl-carrier protein] reductase